VTVGSALFLAAVFLAAYLLGSLSPAYLLGRQVRGIDLRRQGSGNLGAANTLAVLGRVPAVLVLALDLLKGFVPAWSAPYLAIHLPEASSLPEGLPAALAAGGAVLGHCFSPWFRFRGGKGVATTAGALLALDPVAGLVGVACFVAVVAISRLVSLGSLFLPVLASVVMVLRGVPRPVAIFGIGAMILVYILHRENVRRIGRGEEPRIFERAQHT
jgi:glycerol-3-phosphate acyltransferase PlsY